MLSDSGGAGLAVGTQDGIDDFTTPNDLNMDAKYQFTVTVRDMLSVGILTSSVFTLHVGCTDACLLLFDYTDTIFNPPMIFQDSPNVIDFYTFTYTSYTFSEPTAACGLNSVEIVIDSYSPSVS